MLVPTAINIVLIYLLDYSITIGKWNKKEIKLFYPGLVVTSYLEVLPEIRTTKRSVTSLHDFIDFWLAMDDALPPQAYLSAGTSRALEWAAENYPRINVDDLARLLTTLRLKMERYTIERYGRFTKEGLLERSIPVLTRIYELFAVTLVPPATGKAKRSTITYITAETIIFEADLEVTFDLYPQATREYSNLAVIRRYALHDATEYEAALVLPITTPTVLRVQQEKNIELPQLSDKLLREPRRENKVKAGTLTVNELPTRVAIEAVPIRKFRETAAQ